MSASGKMEVDTTTEKPLHKDRDRSTDTRKSHRSSRRSRSRDRDHERRERRHRDDDDRERRKRSKSRDKEKERSPAKSSSHRDRDKDKDRERSDRDRDRDRERRRERDRDRGDRDRDRRDRGRDRDRDRPDRDRDDRRRKREDENGDSERAKRKRPDDEPTSPTAEPGERPRDRSEPARRRGGRSSPPFMPPIKRDSPSYAAPQEDYNPDAEPKEDDSEARSVFVSQLAARLTARDLGYFFEDKLGEGSVMDARIVTDRISRRSKGIGYVEMKTIELVDKAINLSGTVIMGLPVKVQHTEAERNRTHAGEGNLNLPPGVTAGTGPLLYVGSLHFNLTEGDIKQVFEPFGDLEFVDLHRDPATGRSKGYCFIQYKRAEDAKMALEQMEGFELAGRQLRVNTVHEKGSGVRYAGTETLDDTGGANLNAASRQALMQKLSRVDTPGVPQPIPVKPVISSTLQTKCVLLTNMFDPEEETEPDWDKDLGEDVKSECQQKYGKVEYIKIERESQGEIYVQFDSIDSAKGAINGLNGRWFGGKQISATFIPDAIMQAHK